MIQKRKNVVHKAHMKASIQKTIFIFLCVISCSALALGREVSYDQVFANYVGSITKLTDCGNWKDKEASGYYRLIELSMYAQSFLYVDRVATNPQGDVKNVVAYTSFVEFNNDHAEMLLSKVSCKVVKNTLRIHAIAENGYDSSVKKIKIEVKLDNSYSIKGL
jgi:hypothetical protein